MVRTKTTIYMLARHRPNKIGRQTTLTYSTIKNTIAFTTQETKMDLIYLVSLTDKHMRTHTLYAAYIHMRIYALDHFQHIRLHSIRNIIE